MKVIGDLQIGDMQIGSYSISGFVFLSSSDMTLNFSSNSWYTLVIWFDSAFFTTSFQHLNASGNKIEK